MTTLLAPMLHTPASTHAVRHIYHRCQDPLATQSALCGYQRPGPGFRPFTGFGPDRCLVCTDLAMIMMESDSWVCPRCPSTQSQSGDWP